MIVQNTKFIKSYFDKTNTIILFAWMLVNGFFLIKNGIVVTGEAGKYISEARVFIQEGRPSSSNFWFYFTEIFLLAFSFKLKLGVVFVLIIQLLFNLAATFSFCRILQYLFHKKEVALIGTIILLLNGPYQEFNTYLQTESLFYSITLIYTCFLLHIEKLSLKNFVGIIVYLLVTVITRPTGLLFLPATFIYLFYIFFKKMQLVKKVIFLISFTFLFFYILDKALGSGGELDFLRPFMDENIICGVSQATHSTINQTLERSNSIYGLFYYITHNFSQFTRLAWLKTLAFFGLYRSYYSVFHNIFLIIYFSAIHFLAFLGILYFVKNYMGILIYLLSIIFLTWMTVILTCDDWHNRFYLAISPYVIILGLAGLNRLINISANSE
jgi:hypothetical protein